MGEKLVPCPFCSVRFATATDLAAHLQTHEKPVLPEAVEEAFEREAEDRKKRSNFPPIWDWNMDGATFVGKIITMRTITTGDRTWVAVECVTPNGVTRTLAVGPKVLARLWDEKKPKVGDIVAVRNLGKPKGKRYYDFLLVVNPEGVEIAEKAGKK